MIKTMKKLSISLAVLLGFTAVAVPLPASAALFDSAKDQVCIGVGAGSGTGCDSTGADSRVTTVIRTAINLFSIVAGIITVIMVIVSGLKYITSQGDSNSITSAKNTLLYAIVGLIVVLFSQAIVRFVLTRATLPACPAGQTTLSDGSACQP